MAQQDWDLGGDDGRDDDRQEKDRRTAGVEIGKHGSSGDDLDQAYERGQDMREWEADVFEPSGAQFAGVDEFQDAFGDEHQRYDEPDENHRDVSTHAWISCLLLF